MTAAGFDAAPFCAHMDARRRQSGRGNKSREIVSRLRCEGWILERHGAAHDLYVHPTRPSVVNVPRHKDVSIGVARSIAKAAGW